MGNIRIIFTALIVLIPAISVAAGFNCERASSSIEKMICGNPDLSLMDESMTAAYKKAVAGASDSAPLSADQKLWLKNTRNACRDVSCLKKAYQERTAELNKWNEPADKNDRDIFGNYTITRDNYIHNPDTGRDEPARTTDCLTIKKSKGDRIYFSFILVGANGHTCSMDGEAVYKGTAYQSVPERNNPDYPKDCRINIRIKRNTILIEDMNGGCKESFCGMRAVIDGVEFGRKQKTSKECEQF
ncbi:MAG TPA: hypothetical protein VIS94_17335 [Desulfomonilia bacterium]